MSRWLALAEGSAKDMQTSPDSMTKPDKTPSTQPEGVFCQVLSNCQVEKREESDPASTNEMRHGHAINGYPKTWTGKVVSLAAWRQLSEWEKHGPNGRVWDGITKTWGEADDGA